MEFDVIQAAWKEGPMGTRLLADKALADSVMAVDRKLGKAVGRRDLVELVTAAAMGALFIWIATVSPVAWPWSGAALLTLGVAAVFVRERARRRQAARTVPVDLHASLLAALAEADHQITLLRSVVWWYLLPLAGVVALILAGTLLGARTELPPEAWARARTGVVAIAIPIVIGVFGAIWWMNVRAVRNQLLPHRRSLVALIGQLEANGDTTDEEAR